MRGPYFFFQKALEIRRIVVEKGFELLAVIRSVRVYASEIAPLSFIPSPSSCIALVGHG